MTTNQLTSSQLQDRFGRLVSGRLAAGLGATLTAEAAGFVPLRFCARTAAAPAWESACARICPIARQGVVNAATQTRPAAPAKAAMAGLLSGKNERPEGIASAVNPRGFSGTARTRDRRRPKAAGRR